MTNAIIFDTETTGKNEPVLIEAAWIRLDSINPFQLLKNSIKDINLLSQLN